MSKKKKYFIGIDPAVSPVNVITSEAIPEDKILITSGPEGMIVPPKIMQDLRGAFSDPRKAVLVENIGPVDLKANVPGKVLARLVYEYDGATWAAAVTRADGEEYGFQLWFQRGKRFQKSGVFTNTKALIKFIREKAEEKFAGFIPVEDTLDKLKGKSAVSVVPDCYQQGLFSDEPKCKTCPYASSCMNLDNTEPEAMVEETEPEELFRKRLQEKIKDKWGK